MANSFSRCPVISSVNAGSASAVYVQRLTTNALSQFDVNGVHSSTLCRSIARRGDF